MSDTPIATTATNSAPPPLTNPPAATAYFPDGTFSDASQTFVAEWYSKHLVAMCELPLSQTAADAEAIRFLWLRTSDKPVSVRITRSASGVQLTAVRLSGSGGYEPGNIELYRELALDAGSLRELEAALAAAQFDTTPTEASAGCDGAQWVLERSVRGNYRLVERWSPEPDEEHAAFRAVCQLMLDLAGADIVTGDVY